MGECDAVEQYNGVIIAKSCETGEVDNIFYGPSRRKEFKIDIHSKNLPDGREVVTGQWLKKPTGRIGIERIATDLISEHCLPEEKREPKKYFHLSGNEGD